jgi:hypothetical protein
MIQMGSLKRTLTMTRGGLIQVSKGWFERIGGAFSLSLCYNLSILKGGTFSIKGALGDGRDALLLGFLSVETVHGYGSFADRGGVVCGEILFE